MYRYSPHPIESYFIQGLEGRCEAGVISKLPKPEAVWNLFWLSTPLIDNLPGAGSNWLNVYKPTTSGLAAIVSDIIFDKCLREQLLMHPTKFAAWIEAKDMSDHDSLVKYEPNWVETVTERCGQAATRLDAENTEAANIYSVVIRKAGRLPKNQQIKMISSRRKNRTITMSPDAKDFLQSQPVNTSAIVATAIIRVYEDNSLLLKALKRRLALGQEKATEMVRTSISLEESVLEMLQKLSLGSQLSLEEVLRLIIETYIHKI